MRQCAPSPVYIPACVMFFFAPLACRYVLLVSGLNLGSSHSDQFSIETMVDYITGQLGGAKVGTGSLILLFFFDVIFLCCNLCTIVRCS